MTDLFDHKMQENLKKEAPLAARMRPRTLDEYVGQEHIVGEGKLLRRAIEADRLFSSILLWGPPGTGKTTLAQIIANQTESHFETLSAVLDGNLACEKSSTKRWSDVNYIIRAQFSSLTKSIAGIKRSKMPFCLMWRMGRLD